MSNYASGRYSWSCCDCCNQRYAYTDMRTSSYGTRVCPTCYDGAYDLKNHPQNEPPPVQPDPEALQDPRPDTRLAQTSTSISTVYGGTGIGVWQPSLTVFSGARWPVST